MQYETMVMFNITEPPTREEHVAWNVTLKGRQFGEEQSFHLEEIVRAYYRNPQAPDLHQVSNLEIRDRGSVKATELRAAPYIIQHAAQNNIRMTCTSKA